MGKYLSKLDIVRMFSYHPAADEQTRTAHELIREQCGRLADELDDYLPACAEKTLAIRAIQQAMMLANSAIAQHGVPGHTAPGDVG